MVEEQTRLEEAALLSLDERSVGLILTSTASSPAVKEALKKAADLRLRLVETRGELSRHEHQLREIAGDQGRLRDNLGKVPPTSAAYKRYLEKFDTQETDIEKLQAQIKKLQETEKGQQKEYEGYLAALTVE